METGTPEAERDGLLLCITGEGKGKTTSALGMALRSLGWGRRVAVVQFIKGKFETGELRYFRQHHPEVLFEPKGLGLTRAPGDHAGAARAAWESVRPMLKWKSASPVMTAFSCGSTKHMLPGQWPGT